MPTASHADYMVRRLETEIEERNALILGIAQDCQAANDGAGRDLTNSEKEQIERAKVRIAELTEQVKPLREAALVALESRQRSEQTAAEIARLRGRGAFAEGVEYRTAGQFLADYYHSRMGDRAAADRLEVFTRAAAHQTTADNPGLLPERIVEPVINGVDTMRPLVSALGVTDLGPGSWAYARVTQQAQVGAQSGGEKTELASRKMTVTKTSITGTTYGGYVNISQQDIRRTAGGITDMVIDSLQGQYAIETEDALATALAAGGTNSTVDIPSSSPTAYAVLQAVWGAVGQGAAALRTANIPRGRLVLAVAPDKMGIIGPLFSNQVLQNPIGGFDADSALVQGPQGGNLAGITPVMVDSLASGTILMIFTGGVRVFEDRYGVLKVDEPSVWGMQVGVAGDFTQVILNAGAVINIQTT